MVEAYRRNTRMSTRGEGNLNARNKWGLIGETYYDDLNFLFHSPLRLTRTLSHDGMDQYDSQAGKPAKKPAVLTVTCMIYVLEHRAMQMLKPFITFIVPSIISTFGVRF